MLDGNWKSGIKSGSCFPERKLAPSTELSGSAWLRRARLADSLPAFLAAAEEGLIKLINFGLGSSAGWA